MKITIRLMKSGEEHVVCRLVKRVFDECIKEEYEIEGVKEFFQFADPSAMARRAQIGGFVLIAISHEATVGMLEFMPPDRIALFFVVRRNRGIGRKLLNETIRRVSVSDCNLSKLTVHSSLYAEHAYRKMGFHPVSNAIKDHGVTYVPMELDL